LEKEGSEESKTSFDFDMGPNNNKKSKPGFDKLKLNAT